MGSYFSSSNTSAQTVVTRAPGYKPPHEDKEVELAGSEPSTTDADQSAAASNLTSQNEAFINLFNIYPPNYRVYDKII